ncbi:MAG TPA: hydantoinase B/oxoprolinase family protein [Acidimicrobiales bacterium]|nr:hydantoinase B/oxoprolinase family protein [Acidimicrobiales bacterium]
MSVEATAIDPVTLEVIRNGLPAITNEMSYDLQRTSYNMMIYEVRDYSCTLLDPQGRLLAQNIGGVSHFIADMGVIVQDGMEKHRAEGFAPGDVVMMNHPAVAGQHLNNVVIYTPFFIDGKLTAFPAVRAHWVDIGGLSTGFGPGTESFDPWCAGLQVDQLKIYEAGEPDEKLVKMIRDNIRFPENAMGDLRSQIAACRLAERRLEDMYTRYGAEMIARATQIIFDQTERRCRAAVETIPDGVYEAENLIDDYRADAPPVYIHVKVTVEGSDMTIDFTGTADQQVGNMNARTMAAAYIAYKALTAPSAAANEGSFAGLKAIIPEGSIMMATYPASTGNWSSVIAGSVDTVFRSLAEAIPDRIPAGHLGYMGIGRSFWGFDLRRNKSVILQSIDGGGWGGRPVGDGPSASVTVCQGDVRNAPIEAIELKTPVVVEERALRRDSGGPGKFRGGLGLSLSIRSLVDGRWGIPRDRRSNCPPWGLFGGEPGRRGANWVKVPEGEWEKTNLVRFQTVAGTTVRGETPGGGGWGDPFDRDPARVLDDVLSGYVSIGAALEDYGVVLGSDGNVVDVPATADTRTKRRLARTEPVDVDR